MKVALLIIFIGFILLYDLDYFSLIQGYFLVIYAYFAGSFTGIFLYNVYKEARYNLHTHTRGKAKRNSGNFRDIQ
jgi:hypothetical protein